MLILDRAENSKKKRMDVEVAGEVGITNYETIRNSAPAANDDGSVNGSVLRKMLGAYKLTKEI